ncbi:MAG TPA: flagellar biosynthesis protein FliQ [Gammaproteobacteria bacterium]|nr:flagellar biosynthesis protein FliQ [Gammaproteobacteria bacterium]
MTPDTVLTLMHQTLVVTVLLLAVVLLPVLAVGLLVSIFQAATQINEMTLSFIPKLMITVVAMVIGGPWMLQLIMGYTQNLIERIPTLIG